MLDALLPLAPFLRAAHVIHVLEAKLTPATIAAMGRVFETCSVTLWLRMTDLPEGEEPEAEWGRLLAALPSLFCMRLEGAMVDSALHSLRGLRRACTAARRDVPLVLEGAVLSEQQMEELGPWLKVR